MNRFWLRYGLFGMLAIVSGLMALTGVQAARRSVAMPPSASPAHNTALAFPVNAGPVNAGPVNASLVNAGPVSIGCATASSLGSASNAFTNILNRTNAIAVNQRLNTVVFAHRNNASTFGGHSGQLRYDLSTNGGNTWTNNLGVLNPNAVNSVNGARYPQVALFNPAGNTNPAQAYLAYLAPTVADTVFDGLVNGVRKLDGTGGTENYDQPAASQINVPGALCQGAPGVFWALDGVFDGAYIIGFRIYKGVWNGSDVVWSTQQTLTPSFNTTYANRPQVGDFQIAFDPTGRVGWVAMQTHLTGGPAPYAFYPVFYQTTDGGNTWTGPMQIDLGQFSCITSNMTSGNVPSTAFEADLAVDVNGAPHLLTTVCNGNNAYAVFFSSWHHLFDITYHQGVWNAIDVAEVKGGRSMYGSAPNTANMDQTPMAARTADGRKVFFAWTDNSSYTIGSANTSPNLFGRAYDVVNRTWTDVRDLTSCDPSLAGQIIFPKLAAEVLEPAAGSYQLAALATQMTSNDPALVANFKFLGGLTWNDADFTTSLPSVTVSIDQGASIVSCPGVPTVLSITGTYDEVRWSNGATGLSTTAAAAGVYTVTVRVGCATGSATITVLEPLVFSTVLQPPACIGANSGQITVNVTNAHGMVQYSKDNGVNFQPSNVFAGLAAGDYFIAVKDESGCVQTQMVTLNQPAALNLGPLTLGPWTAGQAATPALTVSGGVPPYSFAVTGGTGPNGVTLNANGTWSGVPIASGIFEFTVTVSDAAGCASSRVYQVTVNCVTLTLAPATLPGGTVGAPYAQQLTVTGAFGNSAAFSVVNGALPAGLTLSSAGLLSGTPTAPFNGNLTFRAQDTLGCFADKVYALSIACNTLALTPGALAPAQQGVPYAQMLGVTNGAGTVNFALANGSALPAGMTLAGNGLLSGTPTAAAVSGSFNVTATDANGCTGTQNYQLTVGCPTITLAALPSATAGSAYAANLSASPAGGNYQFSSANLPGWLTLTANGALSGTPPAAGTVNFNVNVTGFGGCAQTLAVALTVVCPALTVNPAALPNANLGAAYTQALTATPGSGHTFSVSNGALPGGLTLAGNGTLTGTPTAAGTFSFTVTATGFGTCAGTRTYSLTVTGTCAPITVNPASLPGGTLGTTYSQTITATGGTAPYTFSVASGALPPGLTLDANSGVISGTPTAGGTFTPTIRATGQGSCTGQRLYVITITCAAITLNPATLPAATAGVAYSQQLTASPAGSYTYSLLTGSLPPGLSLSSSGALSGMTTQTGTYNFTLKAAGGSCSGTRAYTLTARAAALLSRTALAQMADYDGDGKNDFVLWSDGIWRIANEPNRALQTQIWGTTGDVSLLGDYDGDGKTDLAIFRPSSATFFIKRSSDGAALVKQWGLATDVPVPGDYDGDGKTDLAVWRGASGTWFIVRSSDEMFDSVAWGASYAPYNDSAVPGDYDGDGKTDVAVFRRSTGQWLIKHSSDGQFIVKAFGASADTPVPGDYDGDGKTDIAVWRGSEGNWYVLKSSDGQALVKAWGGVAAGDVPAPGDYDGDGICDFAVWRAPMRQWYVLQSVSGAALVKSQGQTGDTPVWARQ
mgnify:CR=1 FL=1